MRGPRIQTTMRATASTLSIEESAGMLSDMIRKHGQQYLMILGAFDTLFEQISIPLSFRAKGPFKTLIREAATDFHDAVRLIVAVATRSVLIRAATGIIALASAVDTTPNYVHFKTNVQEILAKCQDMAQFDITQQALLEKLMDACFSFWLYIDQMQIDPDDKDPCIETLRFGVEHLASRHPEIAEWFNFLMLEGFNESMTTTVDPLGLNICVG